MTGADLLAVPEQSELVLTNLDGGTAKLRHNQRQRQKIPHPIQACRLRKPQEPAIFRLGFRGRSLLTVGISTRSPACTPTGSLLPSLSRAPGPTARTLASLSSLTLDSGRKMPDAVLVSALMRWTRTRSRRGTSDLMDRMEVAFSSLARCQQGPSSLYLGSEGSEETWAGSRAQASPSRAELRGPGLRAALRRCSEGMSPSRNWTGHTILKGESEQSLKGRSNSIDGGNGVYGGCEVGQERGSEGPKVRSERETARKKLMTNGQPRPRPGPDWWASSTLV